VQGEAYPLTTILGFASWSIAVTGTKALYYIRHRDRECKAYAT